MAAIRRAVPSVRARLLADATPCRRSILAQLQSGTTLRTRACPATTLLAPTTRLGGSALSVAVGSRPLSHAHLGHVRRLLAYDAVTKDRLLQGSPELAGSAVELYSMTMVGRYNQSHQVRLRPCY